MYLISELAKLAGLSRATLLYYEKRGVLRGRRQANGYRFYSNIDLQRLRLLQLLQSGGLSLRECQACLDGKIDKDLLRRRLETLDREIVAKTRSRGLLCALMGEGSLKAWHEEVDRIAPDLHRDWLMTQGFSSDDAARVALLSKDMNDHGGYMDAFLEIFSGLDYWGPGTPEATVHALAMIPFHPERILEIGCGNGVATCLLAQSTDAEITAIDTDGRALARLRARVDAAGLSDRVHTRQADMAQLDKKADPFDVIWAEGSAYIMGVANALTAWRPLLRSDGVIVLSDMVWRVRCPDDAVRAFWAREYPAMTMIDARLRDAERAGYRVLSHFDMGQAALDAYYGPMETRLAAVSDRLSGHRVIDDLRAELCAYHEGRGQFGYEMFVMQRV